MQIQQAIEWIEHCFPLALQEDYDNSGLQVGDPQQPLLGVMLAVEPTEEVLQECVAKQCNLLITHHPILFTPLKRISTSTYQERCIVQAIEQRIVLYAAHTNVDNEPQKGINGYLADLLGLQEQGRKPLVPQIRPNKQMAGGGIVGSLPQALPLHQLLQQIKQLFDVETIALSDYQAEQLITTVAICGGSGGSMLSAAISSGAQLFVTGEAKYNHFLDAQGKVTLAAVGHHPSEKAFVAIMESLLQKEFQQTPIRIATQDLNPVKFI